MSYQMKCYGLIAAGVLLSVSAPGFAGSLPADKCYFYKKDSSGKYDYTADQITVTRTWGTRTIPLSAAVGSEVLEETQLRPPEKFNDYEAMGCGKSATITAKYTSAAAPVSGLNPPEYPEAAGKVYPTNIAGIGMITKFKVAGIGQDEYKFFPISIPVNNKDFVPGIILTVTLIKTGDIPPGTHTVTGTTSLSAGGQVFQTSDFKLSVFVENCSIPNKGATTQVVMDEASIINLNPTGPAQPFSIPLTNCSTGPASDNIAKVLFDGIGGSTNADASNGVLGLDKSSKASGIGIQLLKEDGVTPFPLGKATQVGAVEKGDMTLNFNARYIKTSAKPQPGSANAKASFTVSYK
ncbi:fimbrial protein [Erwinia aphidicola]|uniref:fimbrial protein n=1 Tax=Erwinia aphidicola TaxID=68334 RepID=UPI003018CD41